MVFKLVRTDTEAPCKIQLPVGKHLIGRGKFLDCEDKRVSRNHGELDVVGDTVIIKALHQNPCFIIRKGSDETQILKQNCTSNIGNGDKFGLLPDSYWFELLHCTFADVDNEVMDTCQETSNDANSISTEPMDNERNDNDESQELNLNFNDTIDNAERTESPSLLNEANTHSENHQNASDVSTPVKRSHSQGDDSDDVIKKVKTEPEVKQEPQDDQQPDNARAGPSNDRGDSPNDSKQQPIPSPAKPVLRERCIYGASCYRRNPQHKAQFSHPVDADYGAGERGLCPFGAACRRREPRHWRLHEHPPGAQPPQDAPPRQNNQGKKRQKPKQKDSDDDSDNPATDLIVQGKRTRKVVQRKTDWSDSEPENEDPFQTDESDEWQPSSDMTDSQIYTQDTQGF